MDALFRADTDPSDTHAWIESLDAVLHGEGSAARPLSARPADRAQLRLGRHRCRSPPTRPTSTPSPPTRSRPIPATAQIERRIKSLIRWNAMAMVVRANRVRPRHRRPHLDLRLARDALRSRLQPLLPRQATATSRATRSTSRATPRPASTRGRSSRAGSTEQQLVNFRRELRAGGGPVVLPAPVADAGLLGVPHGLDGPRADHGRSTRRASTATWRTAA